MKNLAIGLLVFSVVFLLEACSTHSDIVDYVAPTDKVVLVDIDTISSGMPDYIVESVKLEDGYTFQSNKVYYRYIFQENKEVVKPINHMTYLSWKNIKVKRALYRPAVKNCYLGNWANSLTNNAELILVMDFDDVNLLKYNYQKITSPVVNCGSFVSKYTLRGE